MQLKQPKNTDKYYWTAHSAYKMRQYGLSEQRIKRIIRNPDRIEEGIVDKTIAVMQPSSTRRMKNGKKTWSQEIWAMYQLGKKKGGSVGKNRDILGEKRQIKVISAWRYPGMSPKNNPIPSEILDEIENLVRL